MKGGMVCEGDLCETAKPTLRQLRASLLHTSCDRDRRDLTPSEIGSLEAREGQGVGRFRSYLDEDGAG